MTLVAVSRRVYRAGVDATARKDSPLLIVVLLLVAWFTLGRHTVRRGLLRRLYDRPVK